MAKTIKKTSVKASEPLPSAADGGSGTGFPTHDQIAARAYDLWEQGGRQNGTAHDDWFRAQQEAQNANP